MSFPLQPFQPNNRMVPMNNDPIENLFGSILGLANQLISQVLQNEINSNGLSPMMANGDPNVQVFGISAMNMMQITPGPDGRPQFIQAQEERRLGPGGYWQTKRALRDPQRGIDKMQIGYFYGNQGEIIERRYDPITRQYREEIHRRSNLPNYGQTWPRQIPYQQQQQQQITPALPAPSSSYRPQ